VPRIETISQREKTFFESLRDWILGFPQDTKILIEMAGDNDLSMSSRSLAVGALIYAIMPLDLIPDKFGVIGLVDDVIVIRITLAIIREIDPERYVYYKGKYSQCAVLEKEIALLRSTLGALYSWLVALVKGLREKTFKKRTAEQIAQSPDLREELFDETMEYVANINLDPETVSRALLTTPPERIVHLLSSGLEDDQKREVQQSKIAEKLAAPQAAFRKLLGKGNARR